MSGRVDLEFVSVPCNNTICSRSSALLFDDIPHGKAVLFSLMDTPGAGLLFVVVHVSDVTFILSSSSLVTSASFLVGTVLRKLSPSILTFLGPTLIS